MIVSYTISNFKSIKTEQKLSFIASVSKVNDRKLLLDGAILPVISIYGPNGGGKSSIIESLICLNNFIGVKNDVAGLDYMFNYLNVHKNAHIAQEPTTWKLEFITELNILYKYEISINNNQIIYESLFKKEGLKNRNKYKLIFENNNGEIVLNEEINKTKVNLEHNKGCLFSYLNAVIKIDDIINFNNELTKLKVWRSIDMNDKVINGFKISYNFDHNLLIEKKNIFLKIFNELDINITDIEIVKTLNTQNIIFTKNNQSGTFKIPYEFESEGTKKIIQFLTLFIKFMHNGNIFFVDELDSQLHPKLLAYVIDLFNSENNVNNSQLIYTSHDMYTLDKKFFRKDEIYFAALNENYYTDIVCLNEYKGLRENNSYSNKYLKGELGYDPYIQKCQKWE